MNSNFLLTHYFFGAKGVAVAFAAPVLFLPRELVCDLAAKDDYAIHESLFCINWVGLGRNGCELQRKQDFNREHQRPRRWCFHGR
jgi:hypothetical protein